VLNLISHPKDGKGGGEQRTLRRLCDKEILRTTFGLRDTVTGEWSALHNEELHNLYSSPNIVRVIN